MPHEAATHAEPRVTRADPAQPPAEASRDVAAVELAGAHRASTGSELGGELVRAVVSIASG